MKFLLRADNGDLLVGRKLRDEGMAKAEQATREQYRSEFYATVERLAATGEPFTSEDVINLIGLPSGSPGLHRNNAVGALMQGCARRKIIVRHGDTTQSRRALSHAAELTYWIGAEHMPQAETYTLKGKAEHPVTGELVDVEVQLDRSQYLKLFKDDQKYSIANKEMEG